MILSRVRLSASLGVQNFNAHHRDACLVCCSEDGGFIDQDDPAGTERETFPALA